METMIGTKSNTMTKWVLDPTHSELSFRVKHLMIANVKGEFRKFNAEIEGPDFNRAKIKVQVDAASVFTNDDSRDGHLKGADFFDAGNHPLITFESDSFTRLVGDNYQLTGALTIKGVSRPVMLQVEFGGVNKDPWGNEKAGFSFSGKILRSEWNLNWNAALEAGGVLVSDEVKINGEIQFVKQTA